MYAKMLIGKMITISSSNDNSLVGVSGKVLDETRNTLLVEKGAKTIRVPKSVVTLRLSKAEPGQFETLEGKNLIGAPHERIYKY